MLNGGFMSTFVCSVRHVRAAFGAAGAGGRGETDPRELGKQAQLRKRKATLETPG